MRRGEAQQQFIAINRWWRDPTGWPLADPDLREVAQAPFDYRANVLTDVAPGGLYVLRGPRRVGKTVEIKRSIQALIDCGVEPRRIAHMAVDGLRSRDLGLLVDAADTLMLPDGDRYWFIDEITSITDGWPERIKWLRDNDARFRTDTVVLTGSSAVDLTAATKALAGRCGNVEAPDRFLMPIGFRSFVSLVMPEPPPTTLGPLSIDELTPNLQQAVQELTPWLDILIRAWEIYLRVGGFPTSVVQAVTGRAEPAALRMSLVDAIHGDAFRRADWSRPQSLGLLRRLESNLGSALNVTSLANDIGISQATLKQRLNELREAFVIWPCYRESELRPQLGAQPKLYFTDPIYTQLGDALDAAPQAGRNTSADFSRLSQQQLGVALLRASDRSAPGAHIEFDRVLHHRTKSRKEIDFVGPAFGGLAIESKYVDGGWRRDAQTLRASPWRGIVATRSEVDLGASGVVAVPGALLAWLLDS